MSIFLTRFQSPIIVFFHFKIRCKKAITIKYLCDDLFSTISVLLPYNLTENFLTSYVHFLPHEGLYLRYRCNTFRDEKMLVGFIHLVSTQISRKTNISYPLICTGTCGYKGVRNISFSENLMYALNEWSHIKTNKRR